MSFASALTLPRIPHESFRSVIRDTLLPIAAFSSVFLLPAQWFLAGFLIIGQAHFAMTFLYQYRGGKVNQRYLIVLTALILLLVAYFVIEGTFLPIFLLTATLFAAHFANDEFVLHDEEAAAGRTLLVLLFTALFCSLILYALFPSLLPVSIITGGIFALCAVIRLIGGRAKTHSERYLWLSGSLLLILTLGFGLAPEVLLSLIIILHCINWYLDYGKRTAHDSIKHARYWREVALTLVISSMLYALYVMYKVPFLQFAFLPMYYDAFALGHFALTSRTLQEIKIS